ncbi:MAG: hypothetical protein ACHQ51_03530 [Elusimicrobiota bacterium]
MNISRNYDRLVSFIVSAMVTTSFLATAPSTAVISAAAGPQPAALLNALEGMRAAGWYGMENALLPAPAAIPQTASAAPAAAAANPLSDIQIQKLIKLTVDHGHDVTLSHFITNALGVTVPGELLTVRQVSIIVSPELSRAFQKSKDDGYLFLTITPAGYKVYRTDANEALIAAVEIPPGQGPVAIAVADAQQQLAAEIAYWGAIADRF